MKRIIEVNDVSVKNRSLEQVFSSNLRPGVENTRCPAFDQLEEFYNDFLPSKGCSEAGQWRNFVSITGTGISITPPSPKHVIIVMLSDQHGKSRKLQLCHWDGRPGIAPVLTAQDRSGRWENWWVVKSGVVCLPNHLVGLRETHH